MRIMEDLYFLYTITCRKTICNLFSKNLQHLKSQNFICRLEQINMKYKWCAFFEKLTYFIYKSFNDTQRFFILFYFFLMYTSTCIFVTGILNHLAFQELDVIIHFFYLYLMHTQWVARERDLLMSKWQKAK